EEISWDEALKEIAGMLDALASAKNEKALVLLTARRHGKRVELMAEFAKQFGSPAPMVHEFFNDAVVRHANSLSFGKYQLPTLDLAESKYVISFGADFLG